MALAPGTRLGSFEVTGQIGAGGMGVVYRARDTKLKRDVAIKVLPASLADDADRLARFQREAEVLASLNHPNIAHIHGLEESDGTTALILELVEGPTLADRIEDGPLPVDEALDIALQIADALEAAHGQGIVHRDLKPANIKLKDNGLVKVLDFGIAKALDIRAASGLSPVMETPTATETGIILGTAAYMSPEQARGKGVDERTDIWAYGCVLYEMLTGQQAFGGDDVTVMLARILEREPDMDALPSSLPSAARQTIRVCLQKDVRRRAADIRDVRLALDGAFESTAADATEQSRRPPFWRRALPVAAAVVVTAVVAAFAAQMLEPSAVELSAGNVKRSRIFLDADEEIGNTRLLAHPALSGDGRLLAYAMQIGNQTQLYLRALDALDARPMSGTDSASLPAFSPDGEWLAFFADGLLKTISVRGGPPQTLAAAEFELGASWADQETLVFATGDPQSGRQLFRVSAAGGEAETLIPPDPDAGHASPEVLPGGDAVLFLIRPGAGGSGLAREGRIAVGRVETGEIRELVRGGYAPRYAPTGHIVFAREGGLWAVPFDASRLETTGPEVLVIQGVAQNSAMGGAAYAFADDGTLVYEPGRDFAGGGAGIVSLVWVDREGREEPLGFEARAYNNMKLSPDGRRLAVRIVESGNSDIWVLDLTTGTSSRLTFDSADEIHPLWHPDGQRVFFGSDRGPTGGGIYWRAADATGEVTRVITIGEASYPNSFAPDGQLVFEAQGILQTLSLQDQSAPRALFPDFEGEQASAAVSPDGNWIAYSSNETGQYQLYVAPFPDADRKWPISPNFGFNPMWGPGGDELFFVGAVGAGGGYAVMAVTVATEPTFSPGIPRSLFPADRYSTYAFTTAIAADGSRFLMQKADPLTSRVPAQPSLVLVDNWFDELRRLASP